MLKLSQIAHTSIKSTSRHPRWWILALAQLMGFFVVAPVLIRPHLLYSSFVFWLIAGIFILVLSTVLFWTEICAENTREFKNISARLFMYACFKTALAIIFALAVIIFSEIMGDSLFLVFLLSSIIAATCLVTMLYIVTCGQAFLQGLALALDTWHKKSSFPIVITLTVMLAQTLAFVFLAGNRGNFRFFYQFSVLTHSATIWILFLGLIAVAAFLAAILNCFLVLVFLEIIRRKKDPETAVEIVAKQTILQAH